MYVCAQSFNLKCYYIAIYWIWCKQNKDNKMPFMCSVIYNYVCVQLFITYVCMLFIECDANEIKTINYNVQMYLLFLIPRPNSSFLHSAFFLWS